MSKFTSVWTGDDEENERTKNKKQRGAHRVSGDAPRTEKSHTPLGSENTRGVPHFVNFPDGKQKRTFGHFRAPATSNTYGLKPGELRKNLNTCLHLCVRCECTVSSYISLPVRVVRQRRVPLRDKKSSSIWEHRRRRRPQPSPRSFKSARTPVKV